MTPPINPAVQAFMDIVLNQFEQDITDIVFNYIQNDRDLMKHYLTLLADNNNLDLKSLNSQIPKVICQRYGLQNAGSGRRKATSLLMSTYTTLK